MKVKGLDGKTYTIYMVGSEPLEERSKLHKEVRLFLSEYFKGYPIIEEVLLPGTNNLRADFFIPRLKMVIEANGEQHVKYNPFFFPAYKDFLNYQKNDKLKKEWCDINEFMFIELFFNEDIDGWSKRIRDALKT